jgi:hypothetical protein
MTTSKSKKDIAAAWRTLEDHTSDGLGICGCFECADASSVLARLGLMEINAALSSERGAALDRARRDYEEIVNS